MKKLIFAMTFICEATCAMWSGMKCAEMSNGMLTVRGSEQRVGTIGYMRFPVTPLAHPYNGSPSVIFSAKFSKDELFQKIKNSFGITDAVHGDFDFTVSDLNAVYTYGLTNGAELCAFKPQWAFADIYDGRNTGTSTESWATCYSKEGSSFHYFGREIPVCLHEAEGGLAASGDTHHFNFGNDNKSRAIVYYTKYWSGALAGQARAGLILLYDATAAENFSSCVQPDFDRVLGMIDLIHPDVRKLLGKD